MLREKLRGKLKEKYGLAIIDLETGSTDVFKARLLEIGIIFTDHRLQAIGSYGAFIADDDEGTVVTASALKVNGLNLDLVRRKGKTRKELIEILRGIREYHEEKFGIKKWIPAAWHVDFDLTILKRYLGKAYSELFYYLGIDIPSVIWGRLGTLEGLTKVAKKLKVEVDEGKTHSALYDAWLAYEVLRRVLKGEVA